MKYLILNLETSPRYKADPKGYVEKRLNDHVYDMATTKEQTALRNIGNVKVPAFEKALAQTTSKYASAIAELMKL